MIELAQMKTFVRCFILLLLCFLVISCEHALAVDDGPFRLLMGESFEFTFRTLLGNDRWSGDVFSCRVGPPNHGTASRVQQADSHDNCDLDIYRYQPDADFVGSDKFLYSFCVTKDEESCASAWVQIEIVAELAMDHPTRTLMTTPLRPTNTDTPTTTPSPTQTPTSTPVGLELSRTYSVGRCDPLAQSWEECEDGAWDAEVGKCDCSAACPKFSFMQGCNVYRHWTCLWVECACISSHSLPWNWLPNLSPSGECPDQILSPQGPTIIFTQTYSVGRCDPFAKSWEECEDGAWDAEVGECDCSAACPNFSFMQGCNVHRHWTCLWVGDACYSTTNIPMLVVQVNSNCRSGPGMMYPVVTSLIPGSDLPILGVSDAFGATWWQVEIPWKGVCWISGKLVEASMGPNGVPQVDPPPTPTPRPVQDDGDGDGGDGGGVSCNPAAGEPTDCPAGLWNGHYCDCSLLCSGFSDLASCEAHSGWDCKWNGSSCIIGSG